MKIGVLGSGKGSNLGAIIEAIQKEKQPYVIAVVISDVEGAYILERANQKKIPSQYIYPGPSKTKLEGQEEQAYIKCLQDYQVDLVVLAGFMRVIKPSFIKAFPNKIINIHPSLLPSFKGLKAWKQALDYGVKYTGCTVHFVNEDIDSGQIISQAVVPVLAGDTSETLHQRIQEQEHIIYPEVIRYLSGN